MESSTSKRLVANNGSQYIRTALSHSEPRSVIEEMQTEHGLHGDCWPALAFLDLLGASRSEVYANVLDDIKNRLLERLPSLSYAQRTSLLEKAFPFVSVPELRIIPLTVLEMHGELPSSILRQLASDRTVYKDLPLDVRRQVWQIDTELYRQEVFPVLNEYLNDITVMEPSYELDPPEEWHAEPRRRRTENTHLQSIRHLVGSSFKLYSILLSFFRDLFVTTSKPVFCTLRAEMLMVMHDEGVSEIYDMDLCHKFAWCLDACVRDDRVDERRIREMQSYFDAVPEEGTCLGDLAMILADPFVLHMLLRNAWRCLVQIVEEEGIPKDDENLKYVTQLLTLGLSAREMLEKKNYQMPKMTRDVMHTFYPRIASCILEDMLGEEEEGTDERSLSVVDDVLEAMCTENSICLKVVLYYAYHRLVEGDMAVVEQILTMLMHGVRMELVREEDFIFSVISYLMKQKTLEARMRTVLIENFLLELVEGSPFVHEHFLHLLLRVWPRLPLKDLQNYVHKATTCGNQEEHSKIVELYRTLWNALQDPKSKILDPSGKFTFLVMYLESEDGLDGSGW